MNQKYKQSKWKRLIDKNQNHSQRSKSSSKYQPKRSSEIIIEGKKETFYLPRVTSSQNFQTLQHQHFSSASVKSEKQKKQYSDSLKDSGLSQINHRNYIIPKNKKQSKIVTFKAQNSNKIKHTNSYNYNIFKDAQINIDPKQSYQNNFKQCLKFIEYIEKQFREEQIKVEEQLLKKQKQLRSMKSMILEEYADRLNQLKDPNLRKIVERHGDAKNKQEKPRELVQVKSADNLHNNNGKRAPRRTSKKFERDKQLKISEQIQKRKLRQSLASGKSIRSVRSSKSAKSKASQLCEDKLGKIFTTLEQMKKNLYDYRSKNGVKKNQGRNKK